MGRVHSSSVQGGLLNLMSKYDILLPDGRRLDGSKVAWVADSNYQAEGDSTHTLVTLDDALKRRFTINLTLDYLDLLQEVQVLQHICRRRCRDEKDAGTTNSLKRSCIWGTTSAGSGRRATCNPSPRRRSMATWPFCAWPRPCLTWNYGRSPWSPCWAMPAWRIARRP